MDRSRPMPQEIYRHFKNQLYQVIAIAKHSESGEELVIYQALYGEFGIFARPLEMFLSEVDRIKYPHADQKYRFEKVVFGKKMAQTESKEKNLPQQELKKQETKVKEEEVPLTDLFLHKNENETDMGDAPNPDLVRFLDAETLEEKRRILVDIRTRLTDRLIDDLAASLDIIVEEGTIDQRYKDLLFCVDTMKRFEVERLRL